VDIRTKTIPREKMDTILLDVTRVLGTHLYDVIWEFPDLPQEHLHVEFDPKR